MRRSSTLADPHAAAGHGQSRSNRGPGTRSRRMPIAWPACSRRPSGWRSPVAAALRTGLRRAYADCGWDTVTGAASPGAAHAARRSFLPAAHGARSLAAASRPRLQPGAWWQACTASCRPGWRPLWAGPAGRFLEGGHPVGVGMLLRGHVLVTSGGLADDEAASFLAGVLLVQAGGAAAPARAALHGGPRGRPGRTPAWAAGPAPGGRLVQPAARGHPGLRCGRHRARSRRKRAFRPARPDPGPWTRTFRGPRGRRDHQCAAGPGRAQVGGLRRAVPGVGRARGYELHAAGLLARDDGQAWLRLWVQTLVLAFLPAGRCRACPAGCDPAGGRSARAAASASWPRCSTAR